MRYKKQTENTTMAQFQRCLLMNLFDRIHLEMLFKQYSKSNRDEAEAVIEEFNNLDEYNRYTRSSWKENCKCFQHNLAIYLRRYNMATGRASKKAKKLKDMHDYLHTEK